MVAPVRLPMDWLREVAEAFLPDTLAVARYTETSTSDGITEDWLTVALGVPCRVSPRAATALEGLGPSGDLNRALSHWFIVVPFGTDVTVRDRVTVTGADRVDGRTFEILRIGERSYEASRELICDLIT
jgi:hypothetical protein